VLLNLGGGGREDDVPEADGAVVDAAPEVDRVALLDAVELVDDGQAVADLLHPAHAQRGHDDHAQHDDEEAGDQAVADTEAVQSHGGAPDKNERPRTAPAGVVLTIGRLRRNGNVRMAWR
jgi:hypothetical protein